MELQEEALEKIKVEKDMFNKINQKLMVSWVSPSLEC
jgi:hypothetical protein